MIDETTQNLLPSTMQDKINILVVEDEYDLQEAMVSYLRLENLNAVGVYDTKIATEWLSNNPVDIVILDIGLPDKNGIDWLREAKLTHQCGIIISTARSRLNDKLQALDAGADAYLIKPIEYRELILIIHNIYNRIKNMKNHNNPVERKTNSWILNNQWELICPSSQLIELTKSEYLLLKLISEKEDKTAKKADIVKALGYSIESYDYRRMEALVRRLKNKVKSDAGFELPIKTIHAIGYAFTAELEFSLI